ncbi:hypothetical protein [Arcanobacterium canis]
MLEVSSGNYHKRGITHSYSRNGQAPGTPRILAWNTAGAVSEDELIELARCTQINRCTDIACALGQNQAGTWPTFLPSW